MIDTGGWISSDDDLDSKVTLQSEQALEEADIVLLVVDVTLGVTGDDAQFADLVRRRKGPTLLLANKVDHAGLKPQMWELMSLGLGEPHPISAMHGDGVADVLDIVVGLLPEIDEEAMACAVNGRDHGPRCGLPVDLDRRAPERGQVHTVQPHGGRRPRRRARHAWHDPRQYRHDRRDRDGRRSFRRHCGYAAQGAHR